MGEPQIKAGEPVILACPLCGAQFTEPLEANVKHTCPEEGGCGGSFIVKKVG